jgi:hypothetical protein
MMLIRRVHAKRCGYMLNGLVGTPERCGYMQIGDRTFGEMLKRWRYGETRASW